MIYNYGLRGGLRTFQSNLSRFEGNLVPLLLFLFSFDEEGCAAVSPSLFFCNLFGDAFSVSAVHFFLFNSRSDSVPGFLLPEMSTLHLHCIEFDVKSIRNSSL
jgi:hypothetical protein